MMKEDRLAISWVFSSGVNDEKLGQPCNNPKLARRKCRLLAKASLSSFYEHFIICHGFDQGNERILKILVSNFLEIMQKFPILLTKTSAHRLGIAFSQGIFQAFEKKLHRHFQPLGQKIKIIRADAIGTPLVFLYLLE